MRKNAILTFDYEVFLGSRTGSIENCVLDPTNAILQVLRRNKARSIFFVDTTWLFFLKENFYSDFQLVSRQLQEITDSGSSVELHLHPQWIDAVKAGSEIRFKSNRHYKLHSLNKTEIYDLLIKSVALLQSITGKKVRAFRAGGWCIEPFHEIKDAFESAGLLYDFSVLPGISLNDGKTYDFDFSNAPKKEIYQFHLNTTKPILNGPFTEFPLSTYLNNPLYRVINKAVLISIKDRIYGDGSGSKERSAVHSLIQRLKLSKEKLSLDKTSYLLFKYILQTHLREKHFIVVVSHPKMISPEALRNLNYVTEKYNTFNASEIDLSIFTNYFTK